MSLRCRLGWHDYQTQTPFDAVLNVTTWLVTCLRCGKTLGAHFIPTNKQEPTLPLPPHVNAASAASPAPLDMSSILDPAPPFDIASIENTDPCPWCRGWHLRACPRVRSMTGSLADGDVTAIVFWRDGQYDTTHTLYPEDVQRLAAQRQAEEER